MQGACPVTHFLAAPSGGSGSASWAECSWSGFEEIEAVIRRLAMSLQLHQLDGGNLGPDQQEDSAERRSRSGHGGQPTAAIRSR